MNQFLALIIPIETPPGGGTTPPPGSGNFPSTGLPPHPAFPIFFPPGTHPGQPGWPSWGTPPTTPPGSGNVPSHPIMLPGMPGFGEWPNVPTHPIFLPGMPGWPSTPPGGGGGSGNFPSTGLPPHPAFPIYFPPGTHPGQPGWPSWGTPPTVPPVQPPESGTKPPGTITPPGEVGAHPSTGVTNLYVWVPYVGVVGPIYIPPGMSLPTTPPTQPPVEGTPPPEGTTPPPETPPA